MFVKDFRNEVWKELIHKDYNPDKMRVFVSNYGRLKSKKPTEIEFVLKTISTINNFKTGSFYQKEKKNTKSFYVHKMVGILFLPKPEEDQKFVIHLDHDLNNNHVSNLKFVNRKELVKHQQTNPKVIAAREERKRKGEGLKLTSTKVKLIKRKINDPNRRTRMKMIAKQFGISEMQLYRIKSGENWGHVTED